jgi:tRNA(Ile)-lysidine synthase
MDRPGAVATLQAAVAAFAMDHAADDERWCVALSGGADSLALTAVAAATKPTTALIVDHRLQPGSGQVAATARDQALALGCVDAQVLCVDVGTTGGPEAAARSARYRALDDARGDAAVLLAHTLDDQAETVLLGLARGSGARSLAGMPPAFDRGSVRFARPLLDLDRATTRRACAAMGLPVWDDPHNADPAFTRVRIRRDALPALEAALGPGVAAALARTARMLREDADALEAWADRAWRAAADDPDRAALDVAALDVAALTELPRAVRTRVLRRAAIAAGSPPGTLAAVHIGEVDRLVTAWHGQRHVDLPGGVRAARRYGMLLFGFGELSEPT